MLIVKVNIALFKHFFVRALVKSTCRLYFLYELFHLANFSTFHIILKVHTNYLKLFLVRKAFKVNRSVMLHHVRRVVSLIVYIMA